MKIILEKVKYKDKEILYRLLQYSLFEESALDLNEMQNDALFGYKWFDSYLTKESRESFFIKSSSDGKLPGFAMVNTHLQHFEVGHSIAEFVIIPKYRRNQIGKNAAFIIFDKYAGNWEVTSSYNSPQAYSFWKKVIDDYTNNNSRFVNGTFLFTI